MVPGCISRFLSSSALSRPAGAEAAGKGGTLTDFGVHGNRKMEGMEDLCREGRGGEGRAEGGDLKAEGAFARLFLGC